MELLFSSGSWISRRSQVSLPGTSSWSHTCGFTGGSRTMESTETPLLTKLPSNLTQVISVSSSSISSSCSTDSKYSCLIRGTSILLSPPISACPSSGSSISSGKLPSVPSSCVFRIWTSQLVAGNWTKVSYLNWYMFTFSDNLCSGRGGKCETCGTCRDLCENLGMAKWVQSSFEPKRYASCSSDFFGQCKTATDSVLCCIRVCLLQINP